MEGAEREDGDGDGVGLDLEDDGGMTCERPVCDGYGVAWRPLAGFRLLGSGQSLDGL